ncbi:MAG: diguanylate cyclase [Sedimentisphaerales bacterium]|nr:diguanylate cyclase [Sedimentisphaerales bacterium]
MEVPKLRKILAIDDNKTNLALLRVHLQQLGLTSIMADNARDGIELAIKEEPDVILLDIMMPDMDGFEACKKLKAEPRTEGIPVIFVSAKNTAEDKIAGLEMGAIDYITKPFDPGELKARINIILQMIGLQEKLVAQANTDELTGLSNRRHFHEILEREVLQAKIKGSSLSVIMLDIDHFKSINDTFGHLGGDIVLKRLAKIIQSNIYPLDIAARYGGEEFVIVMPETPLERAVQAGEKLRHVIQNMDWKISTEPIMITSSLGVASTNSSNPLDSFDLVKRADIALYTAKRRGRNRVIRWDQVNSDDELKKQETEDITQLQSKINTLVGQMRSQALGSITALSKALAAKDPFIAHHAENVKIYAEALSKKLQLAPELIDQIKNAALLHDLGKISIPNSILRKTTTLTPEEWHIFKQHPNTSVQIISPIGIFHQELQIIKQHHENFDGTGYPDGLSGRRITFGARILAVANSFDALTSDRQHRLARTMEDTLAEILTCSGTQFDPEIVDMFLETAQEHEDEWPLIHQHQAVLQ